MGSSCRALFCSSVRAVAMAMATNSLFLFLPHRQLLAHKPLAIGNPLQGGYCQQRFSRRNKKMRRSWMEMQHSSPNSEEKQTFWSFISPKSDPFSYCSDLSEVDTLQLSELWAKTLDVTRDPQEIKKALKNSYFFVAVLKPNEASRSSTGIYKKLIGFGRAVSDGAFIATICDVAVDPLYQRRGIGRRIVKELVKGMKRRDGPTGFAVFPVPKARLFFWNLGFRGDAQFRLMSYKGKLMEGVSEPSSE